MFNVVGKTEDGELVISGIMKFRESYGLPLTYIFDAINKEGMIISWKHLVKESIDIAIHKVIDGQ